MSTFPDPAAFDPESGKPEAPVAPALGFQRFQAAVERAHEHPECPAPKNYGGVLVSVIGLDGIQTVQEITYPEPVGCILRELDFDDEVLAQVIGTVSEAS